MIAWEFKHLGELHKEWTVHQESPRSDIFRKRATKPLLKQKHRQKHLTWAKEKNNWTVAQWSSFQIKLHFAFHLEIRSEVSEVRDDLGCRDLLVLIHCVLSRPKSMQPAIYQEILLHFMLLSADKPNGDAAFLSSRTSAPATVPKKSGLLTWYYSAWLASQLWPERHMNLWGIFKRKMKNSRFHQSRWAEGSIVPQQ